MRKVLLRSALTAFLGIGLMAGNASADLFDSTGIVYNDYGSLFNSSTGEGTALIEFFIDDTAPDVYVNMLNLTFDNTIFENINPDDVSVINPGGWFTFVAPSVGTSTFSLSFGATSVTTSNDPLRVTFNYDLVDPGSFLNIDTWEIDYELSGIDLSDFRNSSIASSSGSTSPVPEPATMLLFGSGVIGLAGIARRKKAARK